MNFIKAFFLAIFLFAFAGIGNAQNVKPQFKEITYVGYRPNDSTKKLAVTINMYYHVNSDGILHMIVNMRDKNDISYSGFTRDTTYQLTDAAITKLNTVFNGQKKLSSYMVIPKPTSGTSLLVPAEYITYTADNGVKDQMVISDDFFGYDMNTTLNVIIFGHFPRINNPSGMYRNKPLEAEILKAHLACNCIPKDVTPPKVSELRRVN